jgi:hypothetical protein
MLKVGLFGAEEIPIQGIGSLIIKNGGELVVTGPMFIGAGSSVIIDHGHLTIGAYFWMAGGIDRWEWPSYSISRSTIPEKRHPAGAA